MSNSTKYVFVTGGVTSSLGKGIISASLAKLLQARGYTTTIQKLDPYINIDPGTLNPYEHGECYVTDDGAETDLDLGHYERFVGINCSRSSIKADLNFFEVMIRRIPSAAAVLEMHVSGFQTLTSPGFRHKDRIEAWDRFLARFIMGIIDTSNPDGLAFMKQLKNEPHLMQSGRHLFYLLKQKGKIAVGVEILSIQARLDAGNYIKHGMTDGELRVASLDFQQDFESLPICAAGEMEMMRIYINKLPREFNELRKELQRELSRSLVISSIAPWSWDQLQRLVIAESQMAHTTSGFTSMHVDAERERCATLGSN